MNENPGAPQHDNNCPGVDDGLMPGDRIETDYADYCALVNERDSLKDRVADLKAELSESRNREHEASEQMRACHGRLSRLIRNETGKLWAAEMERMTVGYIADIQAINRKALNPETR